MKTVRLTMAQALVRYLSNQYVLIDGEEQPYFHGVWAIFGHGNVAGLGEALYEYKDRLPTYRAHNEQGMAHAAIAFSKEKVRTQAMICTTSIGPGATNMVTAAALAHVNRLPVLLLPGDVFANRRPDPVLQQIEDFTDGTISANDCFKPVSRYFDRIVRPEQILTALPRAMHTFFDAANCGPVTLSLCQDIQAEAYDYPESFFEKKVWQQKRTIPEQNDIEKLVSLIRSAKQPLIVSGGGVHYAGACESLSTFATATGIPVVETQAGKSALAWNHSQCLGSVGVTGTSAANQAAETADLIIAIGTRLQDFTTASRALFANPDRQLVQVNVNIYDSHKHGAIAVQADARLCIETLQELLADYYVSDSWQKFYQQQQQSWIQAADEALANQQRDLPSDAEVIGAVTRTKKENTTVVCAAGGLPGELHKLWRSEQPGTYHLEYGYSCMGYEIAGGLGVKLAAPEKDVVVMVGDGSYLMMNSEIATAAMLGLKLTIVVLDNRGFGCINRLQMGTGGANFNNLLQDTHHEQLPDIDFAAHAQSLGAKASFVESIDQLEKALLDSKSYSGVSVVVINTDPLITTEAGGYWWDVAVPEVSNRKQVNSAYQDYIKATSKQRVDS